MTREETDGAQERQGGKSRRMSEAHFEDILDTAVEAIITVDEEQRIILFNKGAEEIFGYSTQEVLGQSLDLILPPHAVEIHRQHLRDDAAGADVARRMGERREVSGRRKDGTEFPAEASISKLRQNGQTTFTVILRDITERMRAEKTIALLAYYDSLTGLPNRTLLHDRLKQAILVGQREGHPVAFLLMDVDRFKEINDTLGHHRGDVVLQQLGSLLKNVLWGPDTVSRLGGDEFAVLLPRLAAAEHIHVVIDKILKALETPFVVEGLPICVEVSIGIALYPDHGANADSLMQRADVAMYIAKRSGSGFAIYTTEQDQHSPRRLALMGALRPAIDQEQLFLHYQPKISFKSGRIIGVEALVRWQHPEYGVVPPYEFIGSAEQSGLIKPLTRWVLSEATHQWKVWHESGIEMMVSVNLSRRSLHDPHFPDMLAEALEACGGSARNLELEITESAIMLDHNRAVEILASLRLLGIRLSIDDFGIGYSSLAALKRLPVDEIKIDKSFVIGMIADENDAVIVRSTIDLVHNLGFQVIAEGVENQETWDRLAALGCDASQGYYMSRPLPAAELTQWMTQSTWGLG